MISKQYIKSFFIPLILFLAVSNPLFSWNATGHKLAAQIAYDHLDDGVKEEVDRLIAVYVPFYPESSSFVEASIWADQLKYQTFFPYTSHWHYSNGVVDKRSDRTEKIHTNQPQDIVWAIQLSKQVLQHPKSSDFEKAFALRMLIHLVADIHQPLHMASCYSEKHPKGDRGGNFFAIPGYRSLHFFWDIGGGVFDTPFSKKQAKTLASRYYSHQKRDETRVKQWKKESFTIASQFAYQTKEGRRLKSSYIEEAQKISKEQIALAGLRLADLLNELFSH